MGTVYEANVYFCTTLGGLFIWVEIAVFEILVGWKYGDFFQKSPNFTHQIKLGDFSNFLLTNERFFAENNGKID